MEKRRKLRLEVDQLEVETFDTSGNEAAGRGTVHGREPADTLTAGFHGCDCDTAVNTCWGGCGPTQPFTCPMPGQCEGLEERYETHYQTCMASWQSGVDVLLPSC